MKMKKVITPQKQKSKTNALYICIGVGLVIYSLGLLIPLLWALLMTFVPNDTFNNAHYVVFPTALDFTHYANALNPEYLTVTAGDGLPYSIIEMLGLTFLYATGCATAATLVPCVVAYLAARFNFKFSKIIYGIVIVAMALPIVGALPSEISMAKTFHLWDHIWGLWIMRANFLGIYFLIFFAAFKTIPQEYTEASKIDGANNLQIMIRIIFPMVIGTIGIIFLLNFITFWNDYQIPNYYLPSHPVVGYGIWYLAYYDHQFSAKIPQFLAALFIVALPVILVAIIANKRLMSNFSSGGIKG